jgi:hypothetical protein
MSCERAIAASSPMGSITPWGYCGAEPTMSTVLRLTMRRTAATSTVKSSASGACRSFRPK